MIDITLQNFKCIIEPKTYSFKEGQIIHLVGRSGKGKSTVLQAFEWCLFGGRSVKPKSKKDALTTVTVKIDNIIITREGDALKVITDKNIELDSDVAQGYIYNTFGEKNLWKSCCYLEQNTNNILFESSGEEKLKILRDFIYGYSTGELNNPDYYLIKLQEKIKEFNTVKKSKAAIFDNFYDELEVLTEQFNNSGNEWIESDFTIDELEKEITINTKKVKDLSKKHNEQTEYRKRLQNYKKSLNELEIVEFCQENYNSSKESLESKIRSLKTTLKDEELISKISKIVDYKIDCKLLQDLRIKEDRYNEQCKKIKFLKLDLNNIEKRNSILKDIEKLPLKKEYSNLQKDYEYISELKDYISETEKELSSLVEVDISNLTSKDILESNSKTLRTSISKYKNKKSLKCPKCEEFLYINTLGVLEELENFDIDSAKKELKNIENDLDIYNRHSEYLEEKESLSKNLEKAKKDLEEFSFDEERYNELSEMNLDKICFSDNDAVKIKEIINNYIEEPDSNLLKLLENGEFLIKLLGNRLEDFLENPEKYKLQDSTSKSTLKNLEEKLKILEKNKSDYIVYNTTKKNLEKHIQDIQEQIDDKFDDKKLKKLEDHLEFLRKLKVDYIHYSELEYKLKKLSEYESDRDIASNNLEIYTKLYEEVKKISSKPIEDLIELINLKLNDYLDKIFIDNSIKVVFSLYKQSSGSVKDSFSKISVNLQIYYGENSYPNISSLSGGEKVRVSLALTLALAEIRGTKLLMLDECMSSLDPELKEECLCLIKCMSDKNITVIDVCHESVEGYHDSIISVE